MGYNIKRFKEFFKLPDIQEALQNNDIEYVYGRFDGSTEILTSFFIDHDIQPIDYIHEQLFRQVYGRTSIEHITIPGRIQLIGIGAFMDCYNLKTVVVEEGVKEIRCYAFKNCFKLESIYLPNSIKFISEHAFDNISSNCVIYCTKDSYAYIYCLTHEYPYQLII